MGDKLIRSPKDVILEGIDAVASFVSASMGSKGKFVLIDENGKAYATKDGYSIAKQIQPKGDVEPVVKLMQDASNVAVSLSGDGTTATMVLAQAITTKALDLEGVNPVDVNRGIDMAVAAIAKKLKDKAVNIEENKKALLDVATVSANNDTELATIIADALEKVTRDGMVTVAYSKTTETHTEFSNGMEVESIIDNQFTMPDTHPQMSNPNILLCSDEINSWDDLVPAMEASFDDEKPLIVISKKIGGQALATVVSNLRTQNKNSLLNKIKLVNIKDVGEGYDNTLGDIAALTGGKVVMSSLGHSLKEFDKSFFGTADVVQTSRQTTAIVGGKCNDSELEARVKQLRELREEATEGHVKSIFKRRIARLIGGLAIIHLGGNSDAEKRERKDRVDDAILAVQSALAEGVVIGGGSFILKCNDVLDELNSDNKDVAKGIDIMRQCLSAPIRKMMSNAGLKNAEDLIKEVASSDEDYGYNLESNKIVDMFADGIIDPAKVIRVSLESAASVSKIFANTFGIIVEEV